MTAGRTTGQLSLLPPSKGTSQLTLAVCCKQAWRRALQQMAANKQARGLTPAAGRPAAGRSGDCLGRAWRRGPVSTRCAPLLNFRHSVARPRCVVDAAVHGGAAAAQGTTRRGRGRGRRREQTDTGPRLGGTTRWWACRRGAPPLQVCPTREHRKQSRIGGGDAATVVNAPTGRPATTSKQ